MKVSALTLSELRHRLKKSGIFLQTGPFTIHLQTAIPDIAENLNLLYADYSLLDQSDFADFHVRLARPWGLRRWIKPQVLFLYEGLSAFKPLPLDQAFPMLEWGLNWCVSNHAHDYLMIHAAVIERNGYAAILPAPPGSGKSTLCAALVHRGWRLLSDELALVRIEDGQLIPLPRPVSLKNQSIDIIKRYESAAILSRKVADTMKGTVALMKAPNESVDSFLKPARASWVIFPKYQQGPTAKMMAVSKSQAFMRVADNSFNYSLLGAKGFETLAGVMDTCQCYDFTYENLDDAINIFSALEVPDSSM